MKALLSGQEALLSGQKAIQEMLLRSMQPTSFATPGSQPGLRPGSNTSYRTSDLTLSDRINSNPRQQRSSLGDNDEDMFNSPGVSPSQQSQRRRCRQPGDASPRPAKVSRHEEETIGSQDVDMIPIRSADTADDGQTGQT